MEFKSTRDSNKEGSTLPKTKKDEKPGLFSLFEDALKSQVFFNTRLTVLDYIAKLGIVRNALVTMTIAPKKAGLFSRILDSHTINFDLLYVGPDGKAYQSKNIYTEELPGADGLIPEYILEELKEAPTVEIRFNAEDLATLYDERDVAIDETSSIEEVIKTAKEHGAATVTLIDRVFYTRIECFDSNKSELGAIHVGVLTNVPSKYSSKLYPGGSLSFSLK